ncbi:MAG: 30S ribosomal protein S2 [Candidatus Peregrinibacteria bacterium]|nr:30S ribosomal protein S2 [Candidatus Peregrinibacteria bacterium]
MDEKTLFENELHIGQRTDRWNPKMKKYIHSSVDGVHIFDLSKTKEALEKVQNFLKATKLKNGKILFVGTKGQASFVLNEKLKGKGVFYIDAKWAPGLLTNFKEIRKRIDHYLNLKAQFESGEIKKYTKKEVSKFRKQLEKLEKLYHGVAEMRSKPTVVIVLDAVVNRLSIEEARKAKISVVAVADSNANPDGIDFVIPANDDSVKSIRFLCENMVQSYA